MFLLKNMKSVVVFANGTGGKTIFRIADKQERLLALIRKMCLRKRMPLTMPYQTVVNRQSSRILLCIQLRARLLAEMAVSRML